jgi:hypothetical protein
MLVSDDEESMRPTSASTVRDQSVIEPDAVADVVMQGLADERFLILPHPEVLDYWQRKADDHDRCPVTGVEGRLVVPGLAWEFEIRVRRQVIASPPRRDVTRCGPFWPIDRPGGPLLVRRRGRWRPTEAA